MRRPQQITEEDIQRSENETTKNVANVRQRSPSTRLWPNYFLTSNQIQRILEANGAVNLFRFIINPDDFAQSVENLFYLSFLIRDGSCSLEVDSGEPMICTCLICLYQTRGITRNSLRREADSAGVR